MHKLISYLSSLVLITCLACTAGLAKNSAAPAPNSPAHAGLKELAHTSQMMQRSAMDLIDEVEQTQVVYGTGPQAIGSIVNPPADFPDEKKEEMAGLVPPSKKWVKYIVDQIGELMPILETDIKGTTLPDNAPTEVTGDLHDIKDSFSTIKQHFDKLTEVSKADRLDNLKIGREALTIYDALTKINGLTRRMSHMLRDDTSS